MPTFPPFDRQLAFVSGIQPLPLQLFMPLQPLVAVWQEDFPLHELIPEHSTFPILAFCAFIAGLAAEEYPVEEQPASNSVAAAEASAMPDTFFIEFIFISFGN